jgi:hypothetical protein
VGVSVWEENHEDTKDTKKILLKLIKKFWHYLALLAGVGLIVFEIAKPGGVQGESWFWLVVGVLIVILASMEIVQRPARGG